jgi:histidine triad (HIT) family protein
MTNDECIFCKIVAGKLPSEKVYEDDDVVAFLDIAPARPGHTLVVPKDHTEDFMHTPPDLLARVMPKVHKVAEMVMQGLDADGLNIAVFNGPVAGQEVFHLHFHIIPRHEGDGMKIGFGPKKPYAEGQMPVVADKIRSA